MQAIYVILLFIFAALPGVGSALWLIFTALQANQKRRRLAAQKQQAAAAWVQKSKEFANFFTYDGTQQED